jgi:hypothetical protein
LSVKVSVIPKNWTEELSVGDSSGSVHKKYASEKNQSFSSIGGLIQVALKYKLKRIIDQTLSGNRSELPAYTHIAAQARSNAWPNADHHRPRNSKFTNSGRMRRKLHPQDIAHLQSCPVHGLKPD